MTVAEVFGWFYPTIKSEKILLDSTVSTVFSTEDVTKFSKTVQHYYYDQPLHYMVTRTSVTDSKNNRHVSRMRYPQDYIYSGTLTNNAVLDTLIVRHMINSIVEKRDSLYLAGSSSGKVTNALLTTYAVTGIKPVLPSSQYKLDVAMPVADFQPFAISGNTTSQDSRYSQKISFDVYDNTNNLSQFTGTDGLPASIIWDYNNSLPVAQATNAANSQVAYTSFESDGKGNWTFNSAAVSTTAGSITGKNSYVLSSSNTISKPALPTANYIVSYWIKAGSGTAAVNGGSGTALISRNGWTLYLHTVNSVTSVTVGGTATIDELRLYPANAQMTTYTYDPLIGMTSQCDVLNRISYYEYDALGRLARIRDIDKNILKQYSYKYQGQAGSADVPLCASVSASYSNGKTSGYTVSMTNTANGNIVSFAVAAAPNTHSPVSGTQSNIPPGVYNVSITRTSGTATSTNFQVGNVYQTGTNFGANNIQISCPGTLTISIQ